MRTTILLLSLFLSLPYIHSQLLISQEAHMVAPNLNGLGDFVVDKSGNSYGCYKLTNSGNVTFNDSITTLSGSIAIYKYDKYGNILWVKDLGYNGPGHYADQIISMQVNDHNELFISGYQSYGVLPNNLNTEYNMNHINFLAKLSTDGDFLSAIRLGGNTYLELKENGNLVFMCLGALNSYIDNEPLGTDSLTVFGEMNSDLEILWTQRTQFFHDSGINSVDLISGTAYQNNRFYLFGTYDNSYTFGNTTVELDNYNKGNTLGERPEMYLAYFDFQTGQFEDGIGTKNCLISDVEISESNEIFVALDDYYDTDGDALPHFAGIPFPESEHHDAYLVKLSPGFDLLSYHNIGGLVNEGISSVDDLKILNNDLFVTGEYMGGNVSFENDFTVNPNELYVAKYDFNLNYKSSEHFDFYVAPYFYKDKKKLQSSDKDLFFLWEQAFTSHIGVFKPDPNTITGHVYKDLNRDSIFNGTDKMLQGSVIQVTPQAFKTIINPDGSYKIFVDSGTYNLELQDILPFYQKEPGIASVYYSGTGLTGEQDLRITPVPGAYDVSIDFYPLSALVVNQEAWHKILVKNTGTFPESGKVILDRLQFNYAFSNFQTSPHMQFINGQYEFDFFDLQVDDTFSIMVSYTTNSLFLDLLGDSSLTRARVITFNTEYDSLNNASEFYSTVFSGFDPNYKFVNQRKLVHIDSLSYFEYTIHFQNEGNYPATDIYIDDEISSKLDLNTFHLIDYSHAVLPGLSANKLRFDFKNIFLAPKAESDEASQGFVHYKIAAKQNIQVNDTIFNQAFIYFDQNPAIITNMTQNIIVDPEAPLVDKPSTETFVTIYPNPAKKDIYLAFAKEFEGSIRLCDLNGKIIMKENLAKTTLKKIDLKNYQPGIYFVEFEDNSQGISYRSKIAVE